jgi:PAS domain S-box-containing protein
MPGTANWIDGADVVGCRWETVDFSVIYEDKSANVRGIAFAPPEETAGPFADQFPRAMTGPHLNIHGPADPSWGRWWKPALPLAVVAGLLCLGVANIAARATWQEVEDGVLWVTRDEGVVAGEIAPDSPAADVGLRAGDVLLAIDDRPVQQVSDVVHALHSGEEGTSLRYTVLRLDTREVVDVRLAPLPNRAGALYFLLAAVGIFTLLVGGAVRLRRPHDQATLHFFWLAVAFFGVFTFSFSGRLDKLDWVFYWGDAVSILLLPPLFLHFSLVFPDRPGRLLERGAGRTLVPLFYVPALLLGVANVIAISQSNRNPALFANVIAALDRIELLYLAACFIGGLAVLTRALNQVRSITARRQLRWIAWGTAFGAAPFALGYALPYAFGVAPSLPMELSAIPLSLIPLAYACAIVRYRLMDVEVIVKRGLVYAAAISAIVAIYAVLLQTVEKVLLRGDDEHNWVIALLATLVAVLLAPPVKEAVQNTLDRAFYRDRYDYRRALVGFARDLNSDLDLHRLAERLVSRVVETLLVDRMALMLSDEAVPQFTSIRHSGFGDGEPPAILQRSGLGTKLAAGSTVALDDPLAISRFAVEEIEFWRDAGLYYFVPCVANEGTIAVLAVGRRDTGEPLNSEDTALLSAVAGQIATALENARLYRQLHLKALELDRLRAFNENILESLDDGLLVVDLNDRVVRWNSALEQLYGVSRADASGRPLDELFDAPFVEAVRAARRDASYGTTLSRIPLGGRGEEDGRSLLVNAAVVPLRASDGPSTVTVGTIIIIEDITGRVQLEEQLQISEKMASIGLLAAGVAHEVNTPLTGISSFTQMLLDGADPNDHRTQILEKIERQTFRAAKIVNSLLNLSRPASGGAAEQVPVDLNAVIADVLSLLEHQFEMAKVKMRRELSDEPVVVVATEHKLQQVFLNLFLNARDSMPKGGWLSIATRLDNGRVVAEVSDTGSGIPSEHLARIYDPFFTTKAIGQGTGLGLSITYGIVREHGGSINCESVIGQGTKFILGFPQAPAAERQARGAARG